MKLTRLVAIAVILGSVSAGALTAQTRPGSEPAEFPPASYMGKQYVDSAGCVFIRAGIDGDVSWVPRVTRSRSGVCGFRPTFAGQVTEPEPSQSAQAAERITIAAPAAAAPAPASQPRVQPGPARVAAPAPRPAPAPRVVRQVAQPAPMIVEKQAQPQRVTQLDGSESACTGASAISQQYLRRGNFPVRCGPQTKPILGARISTAPTPRGASAATVSRQVAAAQGPISVSPDRRIVPRHVAVNRVNTTNVTVPEGYRTVWTDGRLNPKRAEQSLAGHAAMSLIWTSTVPRRLINQANGADVTASVPLVYPFTDYTRQQLELWQVTIVQRDGQTMKRILRNAPGGVIPEPSQARVANVQRQPVYSSRSARQAIPKSKHAQPKAEAAANGFVQVGSFSDASAAHQLARQVQRMGIPVRVGRYTRDGQTTRLVIAGPFGGEGDVSRAVKRLRGAGYEAFAR